MLKFCANLNFFYGSVPALDRFAAAARDGFKGAEFVSPYEFEPEAVKKAAADAKITPALFNGAFGDWDKGERGLAGLEERGDDFKKATDTMIRYAKVIGVTQINVMPGVLKTPEAWDKTRDRLVERLGYAADLMAKENLTLLLEHINTFDIPGYTVDTPAKALEVISRMNRKNAMIQYDIYHAQRMSGELTQFLRDNFARIGHIQVADNPARNQPGTGEINYRFIFGELVKLGYKGWIGLEYKPAPDAAGSLGWIKEYGYSL